MTLGQRISQYRKQLGLSQEALGELLGVSRQAVSKWETGAASPDMENLLALAKAFGVSVAELTETPETAKPAPGGTTENIPSRRGWWILLGVFCAGLLLLAGFIIYWYLDAVAGQVSKTPEPPVSQADQTVSTAAPESDFALLWYGADGHEEFLELGNQKEFFPFGTTLELTEPTESHATDFGGMTAHRADCGAIDIGYYHIAGDSSSPEQESIWCLTTMVSDIRTPRGISPGSTKAQVLDAYGDELVYCLKEEGSYSLVKHDYYYTYQTPETFGASLQIFMLDGIVSGIRVEHMAELGNLAFAPDNLSRFPLKNGEPDFSMRQEPETEPRSDTWKIYYAWNQLVTNNNLSAEELYAYRRDVFGLLPLVDWDEFREWSATYEDPDAGIFGLMHWMRQQDSFSPAEILWLQMSCRSKGLDGAYAESFCGMLSRALFSDPVTFAQALSSGSLDDEQRWHVLVDTAFDATWDTHNCQKSVETLEAALAEGVFSPEQAGWCRLLIHYLTAETADGTFGNLPRTPEDLP